MRTGTELISLRQVQADEKPAAVVTIDVKDSDRLQRVPAQPMGPRTELGKERSSRNAIKHGIFSKAILLQGESRKEFESLHRELWETVRPVGRLEELLVDKLASISWRYRRFLLAETGEIQTQFLELDQKRSAEDDHVADSLHDEECLISDVNDPDVLSRCLELLAEFRKGIETEGFQQKRDSSIFEKIYGLYGISVYSRGRLQKDYSMWSDTALASEEEREREGYATPEDCKLNVLDAIDAEIQRLKTLHKRRRTDQSKRSQIEVLRRNVPESTWLDRVLRYEASLERAFDRTLAQLERLQRLRQGQSVAPRLDVTISG